VCTGASISVDANPLVRQSAARPWERDGGLGGASSSMGLGGSSYGASPYSGGSNMYGSGGAYGGRCIDFSVYHSGDKRVRWEEGAYCREGRTNLP